MLGTQPSPAAHTLVDSRLQVTWLQASTEDRTCQRALRRCKRAGRLQIPLPCCPHCAMDSSVPRSIPRCVMSHQGPLLYPSRNSAVSPLSSPPLLPPNEAWLAPGSSFPGSTSLSCAACLLLSSPEPTASSHSPRRAASLRPSPSRRWLSDHGPVPNVSPGPQDACRTLKSCLVNSIESRKKKDPGKGHHCTALIHSGTNEHTWSLPSGNQQLGRKRENKTNRDHCYQPRAGNRCLVWLQ